MSPFRGRRQPCAAEMLTKSAKHWTSSSRHILQQEHRSTLPVAPKPVREQRPGGPPARDQPVAPKRVVPQVRKTSWMPTTKSWTTTKRSPKGGTDVGEDAGLVEIRGVGGNGVCAGPGIRRSVPFTDAR